jgi:asparagine synthase (glutamine-hydrolysing)
MCGIIGLCDGSGEIARRKNDVLAARDLMHARGPDDAGYAALKGPGRMLAHFGHRRLAIQDLSSAGAQPMRAGAGRYTIVYNGEVYNIAELRSALSATGLKSRSQCDTELVLEGYAAWGPAVLDRLRGIFAFAIFDEVTGGVFLARDRMGVKPLYLCLNGATLAFASDARALRALGYGQSLNKEALALYLMLGYVPSPRSIWDGITKLEPGEWLRWRPGGGVSRGFYWRPPDATDSEGKLSGLGDLIDMAVEEQLLSDVPVGLFLSAGIDSSIIASSIAEMGATSANVRALSVSFPENASRDEAHVAEQTAAILGLTVDRLELRGDQSRLQSQAMRTLDEPLGYSAVATQVAVSRLAAEAGMTVVLSGDGGDEVFGGYRWYETGPDQEAFRPGLFDFRARRRARDSQIDDRYRHRSWLLDHAQRVFPTLRPDHVADLLEGIGSEGAAILAEDALRRHDAPNLPQKRRAQRVDLLTFCSDVVLTKVDRAGMAFSVEARPPLLDHRIVEWGLSRPIADAFDAAPKNPLRSILRARGLGHLLDLPKRGFSLNTGHRSKRRERRSQIDVGLRVAGFSPAWRRVVHRDTHASETKFETLSLFSHWIDHQKPHGLPR